MSSPASPAPPSALKQVTEQVSPLHRPGLGGAGQWGGAAKDTLTRWGRWVGVARRAGVHSVGGGRGKDIGPAGQVGVPVGSSGGFASGGYRCRGERRGRLRPVAGERVAPPGVWSDWCQGVHSRPASPHPSPFPPTLELASVGTRRGVGMGREARAGAGWREGWGWGEEEAQRRGKERGWGPLGRGGGAAVHISWRFKMAA